MLFTIFKNLVIDVQSSIDITTNILFNNIIHSELYLMV